MVTRWRNGTYAGDKTAKQPFPSGQHVDLDLQELLCKTSWSTIGWRYGGGGGGGGGQCEFRITRWWWNWGRKWSFSGSEPQKLILLIHWRWRLVVVDTEVRTNGGWWLVGGIGS